jgi:hypothetical protein
MLNRLRTTLEGREEGHAATLAGAVIAGAGAIVLAIGAVNTNDATIIIGGIVMAVGFVGGAIYSHITLDYPVYDRLGKLEGDD